MKHQMYDFDKTISNISNISYYGRYSDDILFIYKNYNQNFVKSFDGVLSIKEDPKNLIIESIDIDGYKQLIPNEKSRCEINKISDNDVKAYIVITPSLVGEYRKLSLKEKDLKEFISGDDGIPNDPVNAVISEIYNYLVCGGDYNSYKKITFEIEEILRDKNKLYLICNQLEYFYAIFDNAEDKYLSIKKKIDSEIDKIDFLKDIEEDKCILNINEIDGLNGYIKEMVKFYNQMAYDRAAAVTGIINDCYKSYCYPIWFCDNSIDRYCKSFSDAQKKLKFYPYNIDISELYFSGIVDFNSENMQNIYCSYEKLFEYYFILNGFDCNLKYVDISNDSVIPYINFKLNGDNVENDIYSGVANLDYDVKVLDKNSDNIDEDYLKVSSIIVNTINEFKKNKPNSSINYLVFPELFLNPLILRKLSKLSKSLHITLVGGCKYSINGNIAENRIADLVYFKIGNHNQCLPIIRLKNEYAPKEIEDITKNNYNFKTGKNVYYVIDDGYTKHSVLYCYEMTDIKVRSFIKNKINLLIASEYNMDTFYFSNIVESVVRDISCFALQSNVSRYGDSRITAPKNHIHMNIASIKGGVTDNVIVGELKIYKLEHFKTIQELKNYICFLDSIEPEVKYSFCEYIDRLSVYYGFKNVSSDIMHQNYGRKAKYVELIDLFIKKVTDHKAVKSKLFTEHDIRTDEYVENYCKEKMLVFEKIKHIIEK